MDCLLIAKISTILQRRDARFGAWQSVSDDIYFDVPDERNCFLGSLQLCDDRDLR